jgi:hypothetical protein
MGTGGAFPRVKRPGREADHSSPSSAEVKKGGAIHPLPHTSSWHSQWLSTGATYDCQILYDFSRSVLNLKHLWLLRHHHMVNYIITLSSDNYHTLFSICDVPGDVRLWGHSRSRDSYDLGRGHIRETGNRNIRELSARVEHVELNGAAQIKETVTQLGGRLTETQLSGNWASQFSHSCVAAWLPSVSCSITSFSDSFVS